MSPKNEIDILNEKLHQLSKEQFSIFQKIKEITNTETENKWGGSWELQEDIVIVDISEEIFIKYVGTVDGLISLMKERFYLKKYSKGTIFTYSSLGLKSDNELIPFNSLIENNIKLNKIA